MSEEKKLPTSERLARVLEAVQAPQEMIKRAREYYYDDYRSPLANPIVQLVNDAHNHGLTQLAQDAMNGVYDGTREEAEAWRKSAEGQEIFAQFGGMLKKRKNDA